VSEILLPIPPETPEYTRPSRRESTSKVKQQALALRQEVLVLWFILKDRRTPWYSRAIAASAVGYVFSPIQLIPSFIPFIGLMDDVAVLSAGMALVRCLTTATVLQDARERAHEVLQTGAENIKPAVVRTMTIVIAAVWLLATIAAAFFLFKR
jgi:uncharacterized membrane protein YkvA (DUF1232 family)